MVFFRLHESPRYLVHAGRPQEAVKSLQMISKFNGSDLEIELDDVADHHPAVTTTTTSALPPSQSFSDGHAASTAITRPIDGGKVDERVVFDAGDEVGGSGASSPPSKNSIDRLTVVPSYDAVGEATSNVLEGHHSFKTPILSDEEAIVKKSFPDIAENHEPRLYPSLSRQRSGSAGGNRNSSVYEYEKRKKCSMLPKGVSKPLAAWWDRVSMVLQPEWFRTTVLVWAAWTFMSLGE
jgi:hypothetical protein